MRTVAQPPLDGKTIRTRPGSGPAPSVPTRFFVSSSARQLKLRRADACAVCARELAAGEIAIWDSARRHARCLACEPPSAAAESVAPLESVAGASARREYERRRGNREARVRQRLGPLSGVVLAVSSGPQHEQAWARGADGEVKLARKLEPWTAGHGVVLLHDRRMPRSRANIDHLAIGPSGVTVIDAKRYTGRIAVERRGGLLRERTEHLLVGARDKTKLVDGVLAQAAAVRAVLANGPHTTVPVRAVLCFVDGDWPLLGRLEVRGVPVLPPRQTAKLCREDGSLTAAAVQELARDLTRLLPAA
jgi:hypothetical protein